MKIWAGIVLLIFIDVIAACLAIGMYSIFIDQPATNDTTNKQLTQLNYRLSIIEQNVANINDRLSDVDIQSMRERLILVEKELLKLEGN